jgi:hypothetical protein
MMQKSAQFIFVIGIHTQVETSIMEIGQRTNRMHHRFVSLALSSRIPRELQCFNKNSMVTSSEGAHSANSSLSLPFFNDYLGALDNMEMRYF